MSASKKKGTTWESAIVGYLRDEGVAGAERRALGGTDDRGDIAGIPAVVVEAKSAARIDLAGWCDEAERERINDRADLGVVWAKRVGKTSPADGYAIMTGATLVRLLRAAGYIPGAAAVPAQGGLIGCWPPVGRDSGREAFLPGFDQDTLAAVGRYMLALANGDALLSPPAPRRDELGGKRRSRIQGARTTMSIVDEVTT